MVIHMKRRTLRLVDFDSVLREVDSLCKTGYDRTGTWTLGQISGHLARVIEQSMDGFPSMLPWIVRVVIRWMALGKILRHEQINRSVKAPDYLMPDETDDRAGVDRLHAAIERLKKHTNPLHPSPAFGPLTNDQWREVHLWHAEHHLSYLLPRSGPPGSPPNADGG